MVRKASHDSNAQDGYRLFTHRKVTTGGETISGAEYEKREAKEDDAKLAEVNQVIDGALSTPEMLLVGKQRQFLSELKANQEVSDIVAGQIRLQLRILRLSPENRREFWNALAQSGVVEKFNEIDALDQKVLEAHPDATSRTAALAGATAFHRNLGNTMPAAFQAQERAAARARNADTNNTELIERTEKVYAALKEANGNKSGAARLLGVSRAKLRRLTGEQM
jgi:transcriptional regulator with GAF, ATPase, and Fis domain